jgi:hypothetical protein
VAARAARKREERAPFVPGDVFDVAAALRDAERDGVAVDAGDDEGGEDEGPQTATAQLIGKHRKAHHLQLVWRPVMHWQRYNVARLRTLRRGDAR